MNFEKRSVQIKELPIIFSDMIAANSKKTYSYELTGNGYIKKCHVRFAVGENGTLHLRPYVILNGNITIDLVKYGAGSYISGDDENFDFECFTPIETHAKLCVDADNTGAAASNVDVHFIVAYEDYIETDTIVGYERGLRK